MDDTNNKFCVKIYLQSPRARWPYSPPQQKVVRENYRLTEAKKKLLIILFFVTIKIIYSIIINIIIKYVYIYFES
jgi:hypothetical protein